MKTLDLERVEKELDRIKDEIRTVIDKLHPLDAALRNGVVHDYEQTHWYRLQSEVQKLFSLKTKLMPYGKNDATGWQTPNAET